MNGHQSCGYTLSGILRRPLKTGFTVLFCLRNLAKHVTDVFCHIVILGLFAADKIWPSSCGRGEMKLSHQPLQPVRSMGLWLNVLRIMTPTYELLTNSTKSMYCVLMWHFVKILCLVI